MSLTLKCLLSHLTSLMIIIRGYLVIVCSFPIWLMQFAFFVRVIRRWIVNEGMRMFTWIHRILQSGMILYIFKFRHKSSFVVWRKQVVTLNALWRFTIQISLMLRQFDRFVIFVVYLNNKKKFLCIDWRAKANEGANMIKIINIGISCIKLF